MSKAIEKLSELEYNELVTLRLIETNSDLLELFYSESSVKFPMIYNLQKEGKMNQKVVEFTKMIFDSVIVTKTEFIDKYLHIEANIGNEPIVPLVEVVVPKQIQEVPVAKEVKPKKEGALPRRYGKENILKDIEKQGGTATSVQRAALSVNRLKNLYVQLDKRLIKDMLLDEAKLSVEDYRVISAAIEMLETKMKPILKKK